MINIKPARRQAYRYGKQFGELVDGQHHDAAEQVQSAYRTFLRQFDALDGSTITKNWLREEFMRGLCDVPPLSDTAARAADLAVIAALHSEPHDSRTN